MVDKRAAHEASIRAPLVVRYPGLTPASRPRVVDSMVLTTDFAPSILDIAGAPVFETGHGKSWRRLAQGDAVADWRQSYVYMYNYERQFPYTPNVRALRTGDFKYIRYPNSATTTHKSELYDLVNDPDELVNLIDDPRHRARVAQMHGELDRQLKVIGAWPDVMPLDEGIGQELPDAAIR
jgi:N-acetylglucosamine-6-sulfatase